MASDHIKNFIKNSYPIEDFGDWNPEDYHGEGGLSSSQLKDAHKSLRLFFGKHVEKSITEKLKSQSIIKGDLTHHMLFEPDSVDKKFALWDKGKKNAKGIAPLWKKFKEENALKTIVDKWDWIKSQNMAQSVMDHDEAFGILSECDMREQAFRWQDTDHNIVLKTKYDIACSKGSMWADLKTTANPHPDFFKESMETWSYDLSCSLYASGYQLATGSDSFGSYYIVVRNSAPYEVGVYDVRKYVKSGMDKLLSAIEKVSEGKSTGDWRDYYEKGVWVLQP